MATAGWRNCVSMLELLQQAPPCSALAVEYPQRTFTASQKNLDVYLKNMSFLCNFQSYQTIVLLIS